VYFTPLSEYLHSTLYREEKPKKSDVIVILSGGMYKSGTLTFDSIIRIKKGFELYKSNMAAFIICTGGLVSLETNKSIAEAMREALLLYGVPVNKVLVQDDTINTYNDITAVIKRYKDSFNFNNSLFVTSAYHTFRTKKILQAKGISARVIASEAYEQYPSGWFERSYFFWSVAREFLSIIYFKLNGYM